MNCKNGIRLGLVVLLLSPCLAVAADPPQVINYQGVLRDASGDPQDGSFDMAFRFFDAEVVGNEILVDAHLALGTGDVTVTGGLFTAELGGGAVSDGSGPGVFTSLVEVFRDHDPVWLELEVGGETLAPRVRVLSSAYAHNAGNLQGKPASEFLDTSGTAQEKTGLLTASGGVDFGAGADDDLSAADVTTLTDGSVADALHTHNMVASADDANLLDGIDSAQFLRGDASDTFTTGTLTTAAGTVLDVDGNLYLDGQLFMDQDGPDGLQTIYFYNSGMPTGEWIQYDDTNERFDMSGDVNVAGDVSVTDSLLFDGGARAIRWNDADSTFEVDFQLEMQGNLTLFEDLFVGDLSSADDDRIFFDAGNESIIWDNANDRFFVSDDLVASNGLESQGNITLFEDLYVGNLSSADEDRIFFDAGNESIVWDNAGDRFLVSNDLRALTLRSGFNLYVGDAGGMGDNVVYFDVGAESFRWAQPLLQKSRFELSDELALVGPLRVGSTSDVPVTYNWFGSLGNSPDSGDMDGDQDLYIEGDLELDSQLYLNREIFMDDDGGEGEQNIRWYEDGTNNGERFQWDNTADRFEVSDDFAVFGDLSATGTKPFIQNHPYRKDLEVVFTALEGDEVTTFTRGFARLEAGQAEIKLGETFALVTNPDIGLTAHVTAMGTWSDLYVESITTSELVVRSRDGAAVDVPFSYIVYGLRVGYEESPALRKKKAEAYVPPPGFFEQHYSESPDLRDASALARYRSMNSKVFGREAVDLSASRSLCRAIGERDPGFDYPVGSTVPVALMDVAQRAEEPSAPQAGAPAPVPAPDQEARGADPSTVAQPARASRVFEDEAGNLYANSFRPSSTDLASLASVAEPVEAGDVVVIDPERPGMVSLAREAGDTAVFGIVAGEPGVVLGAGRPEGDQDEAALHPADPSALDRDEPTDAPVAVSGVVLAKVDAGYGEVRPGDLLMTSPTTGHAMRADDPRPGTILGKALEPLEFGTGLIKVLVMLR